MRRRILLIIYAYFIIMNSSYAVFACSCIGEESVKAAFRKYDVIVVGRVISIDNITMQVKNDPIQERHQAKLKVFNFHFKKVTIEVRKIYKGKIKTEIIEIITGQGRGDCGFPFQIGETYLIYSSFENTYFEQGEKVSNYLFTDICSRTTHDFIQETAAIKKEIKRLRWRLN